jgi:hypothetical protein
LKPLGDFLEKPWWNRIWTLQESVLPPKLIFKCGESEIVWQAFEETMQRDIRGHIWECCDNAWYMLPSLDQNAINNYYVQIQSIWSSPIGGKRDLLLLLDASRGRGATDPRDKIFALLGIANPDTISPVDVRYDIPVIDIYQNYAMAHIRQYRNLFILS